nr:ribonuclease H-like domain-containing protein [Tanacetum cinerariifolium]
MYDVRCTRPNVEYERYVLVYGGKPDTELDVIEGYVFVINGGAVDWKSKKQTTTAMHSAQAKYVDASKAAMEAVWIRKFVGDLGVMPLIYKPINMYCDNSAAIIFANEPGIMKGARNFLRRYHYVREQVGTGEIKLIKVHTDDNLADPFTKALPRGMVNAVRDWCSPKTLPEVRNNKVANVFQEEDELEYVEPLDGEVKQVTYVVQRTLCSPKGLIFMVTKICKVPLAIGEHYNEFVSDVVDMGTCHEAEASAKEAEASRKREEDIAAGLVQMNGRELFTHEPWHNVDGSLNRYKARLVVNGSSQLAGIDVDETFSPVVKPATIRTVLSLAISRHWPVHQLDVKNAFLNGYLSETVYILLVFGTPSIQIMFVYSSDLSMVLRRHLAPGDDTTFLLLYVDDIVLTASSDHLLQQIIASLPREFSMTDLGALNYFLGISVTRDSSGMFLSQHRYTMEILEHAHMAGCPTTRRSTSGYCVFLGHNLLSWSSKRQPTLSRSSVEAEYRGVANAVAMTCWIWNLLRDLHTPLSSATIVYYDNVSAVYLSSNPVQHQRTKYIEIDIHFVRDLVATRQPKSQVYSWIQHAITRNVQEVDIKINTGYNEMFNYDHELFFNNSCLLSMKLSFCAFNPPNDAIRWDKLKCLYIDYGKLDEDLMGKILSGSPCLETPELGYFYFRGCLSKSLFKNFSVERLSCRMRTYKRFINGDEVFWANLDALRMKLSRCVLNPPNGWGNLNFLCIRYTILDEDSIGNILSGTCLETLELYWCNGVRRIDVASNSVKNLVLSDYGYIGPGYIDTLEIDAPYILSLTIKGNWIWRRFCC